MMVLLLILSIFVVAAIILLAKRLSLNARATIAVAAFVLINLPTIMALIVGDKPPPEAKTVTQEELQGGVKDE